MEQFNQEQAEHLANLKNKRKAMFDQMNVTPTFTQDQINQGADSFEYELGSNWKGAGIEEN